MSRADERVFVVALLGLAGCVQEATQEPLTGESAQAIIYGQDDRVERYEAPDPFATLASNSTVAFIPASALHSNGDGSFTVEAPSLGEADSLCPGEHFADQPAAASCSGVLVGDDLVATSAHCTSVSLDGIAYCPDRRIVFGYELADPHRPAVIVEGQLFDCAEVVIRAAGSRDGGCRFDLALIRLDRKVSPPLRAARIRHAAIADAEALAVIGFPSGVPVKVDLGAHVIDAREAQADYFTLDSDTFAVSSGSGVFDERGDLVGLFARGQHDYEDAGSCQRINRADADGGPVEEATRIEAVAAALEAIAQGEQLPACEREPPCNLRRCEPVHDTSRSSQSAQTPPSCTVFAVGSRRRKD